MIRCEQFTPEIIGSGIVSNSSFTNSSFDINKFWNVESALNQRPIDSNIALTTGGKLSFAQGDRHGYILYALSDATLMDYRAVASTSVASTSEME